MITMTEIARQTGERIKSFAAEREDKETEYMTLEAETKSEPVEQLKQARLQARIEIEKESISASDKVQYLHEATKFDRKHKCTMDDLVESQSFDVSQHKLKMI